MEQEESPSPNSLSGFMKSLSDWFAVLVRLSWLAGAGLFLLHVYGWMRFGEWKPIRLGHAFPSLFRDTQVTGWVKVDDLLHSAAFWQLWIFIPLITMLFFFLLMLIGDKIDAVQK